LAFKRVSDEEERMIRRISGIGGKQGRYDGEFSGSWGMDRVNGVEMVRSKSQMHQDNTCVG
jgi:hypothetical protein